MRNRCTYTYSFTYLTPSLPSSLSYSYDRIDNLPRQSCYCGSKTCARVIGGKKKIGDKIEPRKRAVNQKAARMRAKMAAADDYCFRCRYVNISFKCIPIILVNHDDCHMTTERKRPY
jgi:hypothetical protein